MKEKDINILFENFRNEKSIELFNKPIYELQISEWPKLDQYIHDILYPIWKDIIIDNINTGYKISNIGTVLGKRGEVLNPDISNVGYLIINGYLNGKRLKFPIHRLVAIAFIPNPENKPQVNHINGNKKCNWVGNLEWVTAKENTQHAITNKLMNFKGENHPENIYSEDQIRLACKLLQDPTNKISDISKKTGINRSVLYSIRTGKSWTHISKEYNIKLPESSEIFSEESLENAAYLLSHKNLSYTDISKLTGIPYRTLKKMVQCRPAYQHLSLKYKLSEIRNSEICSNDKRKERTMNDKTKFIYDLLILNTDKKDIAKMLINKYNITNMNLAIRSINKVNRKYMQ